MGRFLVHLADAIIRVVCKTYWRYAVGKASQETCITVGRRHSPHHVLPLL
ncbi:hypothetical protein SAMN04488005_2552 [Yoonia tamlensis]|uniref:Uncharacterized protein n=1 Tax=Yoonia tamlensis TaxID=390270 RepID=A0A1I6HDC0_9RHOB|nr:hypothetical protein SAMN04488005_2552 [Yoonia tamlensis]